MCLPPRNIINPSTVSIGTPRGMRRILLITGQEPFIRIVESSLEFKGGGSESSRGSYSAPISRVAKTPQPRILVSSGIFDPSAGARAHSRWML